MYLPLPPLQFIPKSEGWPWEEPTLRLFLILKWAWGLQGGKKGVTISVENTGDRNPNQVVSLESRSWRRPRQGTVSALAPVDCKQPSTTLSVRPAAINSELNFALCTLTSPSHTWQQWGVFLEWQKLNAAMLFACQGLGLKNRPERTKQLFYKPPVGRNTSHSAIFSLGLAHWQIFPESFISPQYKIRLVERRQTVCLRTEVHL